MEDGSPQGVRGTRRSWYKQRCHIFDRYHMIYHRHLPCHPFHSYYFLLLSWDQWDDKQSTPSSPHPCHRCDIVIVSFLRGIFFILLFFGFLRCIGLEKECRVCRESWQGIKDEFYFFTNIRFWDKYLVKWPAFCFIFSPNKWFADDTHVVVTQAGSDDWLFRSNKILY